jgi:hypothetical protein
MAFCATAELIAVSVASAKVQASFDVSFNVAIPPFGW